MDDTLYIGLHHCLPEAIKHCKQELKQIDTINLQYTANGKNMPFHGPKKLWTRISLAAASTAHRFDFECGAIVQIGCALRLWKKVSPGKIVKLKYEICENSIEGHDKQGNPLCHLIGEQEISIPENIEFISYRPWLDMMITDIQGEGKGQWYFEAEEI
ncbi:MAG: hypothetical protein AAB323_01180 [Pseudomonadota bacterium]